MNGKIVVLLGAAVAAVLVVVLAVVLLAGEEEDPVIEGLQTFEDLPTTHVQGDVEYADTPPAGGKHWGEAWLACGTYDAPVPDELAVHDLEHGSVWITYDPAVLDDAAIATLADALPDNGIMSPYDGLQSPVVLTAWERQLELDSVDDERLELFVEAFESDSRAPEAAVGCGGGGAIGADRIAEVAAAVGGSPE